MISRMYTVEELHFGDTLPKILEIYKGFDGNLTGAKFIAIVSVQGEEDYWGLDDAVHAVAELKRFYKNDGEENYTISVYTRSQITGPQ